MSAMYDIFASFCLPFSDVFQPTNGRHIIIIMTVSNKKILAYLFQFRSYGRLYLITEKTKFRKLSSYLYKKSFFSVVDDLWSLKLKSKQFLVLLIIKCESKGHAEREAFPKIARNTNE